MWRKVIMHPHLVRWGTEALQRAILCCLVGLFSPGNFFFNFLFWDKFRLTEMLGKLYREFIYVCPLMLASSIIIEQPSESETENNKYLFGSWVRRVQLIWAELIFFQSHSLMCLDLFLEPALVSLTFFYFSVLSILFPYLLLYFLLLTLTGCFCSS